MSAAQHTQGRAYVGAQNDALYIVLGEAPASTNDYPCHDADRTAIAKVYSEQDARRLVACWNACEGMQDPEAEVAALRKDSEYLMASERLRAQAIEQRNELLAVAENLEISCPDDDGLVWLILHGKGTTGRAMFQLGKPAQIAVQTAMHLEQDRCAAIGKATGQEGGAA